MLTWLSVGLVGGIASQMAWPQLPPVSPLVAVLLSLLLALLLPGRQLLPVLAQHWRRVAVSS